MESSQPRIDRDRLSRLDSKALDFARHFALCFYGAASWRQGEAWHDAPLTSDGSVLEWTRLVFGDRMLRRNSETLGRRFWRPQDAIEHEIPRAYWRGLCLALGTKWPACGIGRRRQGARTVEHASLTKRHLGGRPCHCCPQVR